jgi:hypothetical protein
MAFGQRRARLAMCRIATPHAPSVMILKFAALNAARFWI